jgi:antitoxin (DNA-binding transcriptional repressor) of toxin-antitoxin stability system
MKIFTTEDLRGKASELRKAISREPQALLTASGEPVALLVPVESATLDETVTAIRQARAQLALKSIRLRARKTARNRMTITQIDRAIAATRKARHRRKALQEKRQS